jgi:CRP-like cAMP-binding protein
MSNSQEALINFILSTFPMPLEMATTIASKFSEKEFSKNDFILKEGKVCNDYYFMDSGFARAFTHDLDGNDVTTGFYSSNQVVCEIFSFFKRLPSGENIQALTDCQTLHLTFDGLQEVFHAMPMFREFGRTILINSYGSLKQRMLSMHHQTAEERYVQLMQSKPDIFQHAPLKNIASFLGITDTSLSRIRKEFAKK